MIQKYRKALIVSPFLCFRFATKESATHAIVAVHNTDINGQPVKCSWGKETGDPNGSTTSGQVREEFNPLTSTQFPYTTYGQQLGYWYPQSYPTTAAAAQLQGQFLQGMQGYTYGQFGYQQGYMGRMGMQLPGTTAWPTQPQLPSQQLASAVAAQGAGLQQPTPPAMMAAYPTMQQFQVSTIHTSIAVD
ncbi:nucleolysin TIA-1-like [Diaphorina citri]|uniref:Nucleolysin TIA-1-like n=1 Tax=Diaphorina citri TaxID=121845 RepID=A0A3Q0J5T0_DIACI|nr:nucleolysin TIA-1-like [Diaphorina citri]